MTNPFVAEIRIFPFNFAPTGWATCDGQILPLSQNTALFSLLGTTYGGDGKSTFALPDMQGNAPMFYGQGAGLSLHDLGESGGSQTVTLLESEIPVHSHTMSGESQVNGNKSGPSSAATFGRSAGGTLYQTANDGTIMAAGVVAPAGGDQPHNNMQPYITLNFCIALQGVFPPRT
jgi:microcystin-dependent protein